MFSDSITSSRLLPRSETASVAEMKFAGHYMNLCGVLLFMTGLVSYLKSSGTSSGVVETGLGCLLGLLLLASGEYYFSRGLESYSQALLTTGTGLLFLVACSGHFRHGLYSQSSLFLLLLPVVVFSNASVFRYDSKLLGNSMLVVYFAAPLVLEFSFTNFTVIMAYLLAINIGSVLVAFYKKWDFQILVSSLGSYALFFSHYRDGNAVSSLCFLLSIYGLYVVANNLLYFVQPEAGRYNLTLSMINPIVFATLSAMVIFGLPNWARVSIYILLAVVHGVIAVKADIRREQDQNFTALATSSLVLCLLFVCAAISFVTYFSDSTTYFGLVTLLWFLLAKVLLLSAFSIPRHGKTLCRFSYFGICLASMQLLFVIPTMANSALMQWLALGLLCSYLGLFLARLQNLTKEQVLALYSVAALSTLLTLKIVLGLTSGLTSVVLLLLAGYGCLRFPIDKPGLRYSCLSAQLLVLVSAIVCISLPLQQTLSTNLAGMTLVSGAIAYFYHRFRMLGAQQLHLTLSLGAGILVFMKFSFAIQSGPFSTFSWVVLAALTLYWSGPAEERRWNYFGQGLFDFSRLLFFCTFLKAILVDANYTGALQGFHYPLAFLSGFTFLAVAHLIVHRREVRNIFVVMGLLMCCFQLTFLAHGLWGDRLIFQPLLSGFWSGVGFLVVAGGLALNTRVYRLFGLTTLVANTAKVLVVDIHLLDSYSQSNTFLILGALLMMTSLLYQRNKDRLTRPEMELSPVC